MRAVPPPYLWIFLALPACATYEQSPRALGGAGAVSTGGAVGQLAGSGNSIGGMSGADPGGSNGGEQPSGGSSEGGVTSGGGWSGGAAVTAGTAGVGTGNAGAGGTIPTGGAGGTTSAGAGGAGAGGAGAPAAGASAGGGTSINPCDHTNWTATASESSLVMPNLYNPPSYAIDGMAGTRWSSGMPPKGGEWFLVDLGAKAKHLTKVVLDTTNSTGDIPPAYKLELSVDNANYTQVATGTGVDLTTITFADTAARYIKVTQTQTSSATQGHWWSIHELTLECTP